MLQTRQALRKHIVLAENVCVTGKCQRIFKVVNFSSTFYEQHFCRFHFAKNINTQVRMYWKAAHDIDLQASAVHKMFRKLTKGQQWPRVKAIFF